MPTLEYVYNGHDNAIDLLLKADGVAVDLSAATRMVIRERSGAFEIDSDDSPGAFDWDVGTTGKVVLALGRAGLTVGNHACRLIVYDASNDDGVVWGDDYLVLAVK